MTLDPRMEEIMRNVAVLDTKMKELYGNGKPGRMEEAEVAIGSLNRWQDKLIGGLAVLTAIIVPVLIYLAQQWVARNWGK